MQPISDFMVNHIRYAYVNNIFSVSKILYFVHIYHRLAGCRKIYFQLYFRAQFWAHLVHIYFIIIFLSIWDNMTNKAWNSNSELIC